MASTPRIRVVRTRNSSSSSNSGIRYEYPVKDNIMYIRQPHIVERTPENIYPRTVSSPKRHPVSQRRNCVKRLCAGIFNFFRFRTTNIGYSEELRYPSPAMCYNQDRPFPFQSSATSFEPSVPVACTSLMNYGHWQTEESDEGEYIVYIPRMSRANLQKKFVDPLRRTNFDPVIIHPLCPQCVSCRDLAENRTKENTLHSRTREASNNGNSRLHKKSRYRISCCASMENIIEQSGSNNTEKTKESKNACGDSRERHLLKKESIQNLLKDSKNTNFLFIPTSKACKEKKHTSRGIPFKIAEKSFCWDSIQERHNRATRNRQRIMQELKDRLQTQFAIWMRRKLIGHMKKKLAIDEKPLSINPPNMVESRFHHIHWLGRNDNLNNSVGRYFDKENNTVVALKIFSDTPYETKVENLDNKLMAIQEINSLKKMNHKNIVKLYGFFELHDKYHLILESCDHNLREEIEKNPCGLGTSASKKMIKCILNGLHFCHQVNCLHRDLCPENVLVCKNGLAKIGDFDRSVFITDAGVGTTSPTPGSYIYNSPEILAGDKKYGLPSDVWSLGVIFCELLIGRPPWNGKSAQSQLREIHNSVGPLLPRHASIAKLQTDSKETRSYAVHNHAQLQQMFTTISKACRSFIMKCLDVNPLCRFTCGELLQHQFMKGK